LIQKLVTKEKEMPPLKTTFRQELISSARLQPYETRIQENLSALILTTLGRVLKQNKRRALWTSRLRNLSLLSHHALVMHLKGGKPDDTTRGCLPEMQNVDCSGLWPN